VHDQIGSYIATASNGAGEALTLQLAACPALSTCDRILWGLSVALAQCQSQRRIHKNVLRHGRQSRARAGHRLRSGEPCQSFRPTTHCMEVSKWQVYRLRIVFLDWEALYV